MEHHDLLGGAALTYCCGVRGVLGDRRTGSLRSRVKVDNDQRRRGMNNRRPRDIADTGRTSYDQQSSKNQARNLQRPGSPGDEVIRVGIFESQVAGYGGFIYHNASLL